MIKIELYIFENFINIKHKFPGKKHLTYFEEITLKVSHSFVRTPKTGVDKLYDKRPKN